MLYRIPRYATVRQDMQHNWCQKSSASFWTSFSSSATSWEDVSHNASAALEGRSALCSTVRLSHANLKGAVLGETVGMQTSPWSPIDGRWRSQDEFALALQQLCAVRTTPAVLAYIDAELEREEQNMGAYIAQADGPVGYPGPSGRDQDGLAFAYDLTQQEQGEGELYLNLFNALALLDPDRCRDRVSRGLVETPFDLFKVMLLNRADHWGVVVPPESLQRFLVVAGGSDVEGAVLAHLNHVPDLAPYAAILDQLCRSVLVEYGDHGEALPIAERAWRLRHPVSDDGVQGR